MTTILDRQIAYVRRLIGSDPVMIEIMALTALSNALDITYYEGGLLQPVCLQAFCQGRPGQTRKSSTRGCLLDLYPDDVLTVKSVSRSSGQGIMKLLGDMSTIHLPAATPNEERQTVRVMPFLLLTADEGENLVKRITANRDGKDDIGGLLCELYTAYADRKFDSGTLVSRPVSDVIGPRVSLITTIPAIRAEMVSHELLRDGWMYRQLICMAKDAVRTVENPNDPTPLASTDKARLQADARAMAFADVNVIPRKKRQFLVKIPEAIRIEIERLERISMLVDEGYASRGATTTLRRLVCIYAVNRYIDARGINNLGTLGGDNRVIVEVTIADVNRASPILERTIADYGKLVRWIDLDPDTERLMNIFEDESGSPRLPLTRSVITTKFKFGYDRLEDAIRNVRVLRPSLIKFELQSGRYYTEWYCYEDMPDGEECIHCQRVGMDACPIYQRSDASRLSGSTGLPEPDIDETVDDWISSTQGTDERDDEQPDDDERDDE